MLHIGKNFTLADDAVTRRLLSQCKNWLGCVVWTGYTKNGYGVMSVKNRHRYCHRIAYESFIGPIPKGMLVCHTCDVRTCIKPEHLFIGTDKDNHQDATNKGRMSKPPKFIGEKNHKAKLKDREIKKLRELHLKNCYSQRDLASIFSCSQSTVWRIVHGITRLAVGKQK